MSRITLALAVWCLAAAMVATWHHGHSPDIVSPDTAITVVDR